MLSASIMAAVLFEGAGGPPAAPAAVCSPSSCSLSPRDSISLPLYSHLPPSEYLGINFCSC